MIRTALVRGVLAGAALVSSSSTARAQSGPQPIPVSPAPAPSPIPVTPAPAPEPVPVGPAPAPSPLPVAPLPTEGPSEGAPAPPPPAPPDTTTGVVTAPPPPPPGTSAASRTPPPPTAAPPPPYWQPPPAPASVPTPASRRRLPYTHDGFFLRAAAGPGWFHAWTDSTSDTRRFYGTAAHVEVSMGGTPATGFVFGGTVTYDRMFGVSSHDDVVDGDEPTLSGTTFSMNVIGVFADWYPDPKGGLDLHAMLGVGTLVVSRPGGPDVDNPDGITGAIGAGYDWFVDPQLSLGVHGRLTIGSLSVSEFGNRFAFAGAGSEVGLTVLVPSLVFAVTYH